MKNLFLFVLLFAASASQISAQSFAKNVNLVKTSLETEAPIAWEAMAHEFGEIPKDVPAKAQFILTNNSTELLVIEKVKGSCGCTATAHSEEAILPGKSTVITASYNAKKAGLFNKTITVNTNLSEKPSILRIKGKVVEGK